MLHDNKVDVMDLRNTDCVVILVRGGRDCAILVQFGLNADQGRTASIDLVISFSNLKGGQYMVGKQVKWVVRT